MRSKELHEAPADNWEETGDRRPGVHRLSGGTQYGVAQSYREAGHTMSFSELDWASSFLRCSRTLPHVCN